MSDFTVLISEVHPANEMGNDLLFLNLVVLSGDRLTQYKPRILRRIALIPRKLVYGFNLFVSSSVIVFRSSELKFNRELKWLVDAEFLNSILKGSKKTVLSSFVTYSEIDSNNSFCSSIANHRKLQLEELNHISASTMWKLILKFCIAFRYRRK
jgi:hypothetical protein